jgi:hypothetical protein
MRRHKRCPRRGAAQPVPYSTQAAWRQRLALAYASRVQRLLSLPVNGATPVWLTATLEKGLQTCCVSASNDGRRSIQPAVAVRMQAPTSGGALHRPLCRVACSRLWRLAAPPASARSGARAPVRCCCSAAQCHGLADQAHVTLRQRTAYRSGGDGKSCSAPDQRVQQHDDGICALRIAGACALAAWAREATGLMLLSSSAGMRLTL